MEFAVVQSSAELVWPCARQLASEWNYHVDEQHAIHRVRLQQSLVAGKRAGNFRILQQPAQHCWQSERRSVPAEWRGRAHSTMLVQYRSISAGADWPVRKRRSKHPEWPGLSAVGLLSTEDHPHPRID